MTCRRLYMWSLTELVGAFVDLAIAYFFLCASAVAYIASKFLGFFGLCLPCPLSNYCVQGLLIDHPTERVSNVLLSVRNKFPFNEFGIEKGVNSNFGGYIMEGSNEVEGSCSSMSGSCRKGRIVRRLEDSVVGEGGFDLKGKWVMNERSRGLLRRRRRGAHHGRKRGDVSGGYSSLSDSISKGGQQMVEDIIGHSDNAIDSYYVDDNQTSRVISLGARDAILAGEFLDENDEEEKLSSLTVAMAEPSQKFACSCGDKDTVKILEQALKKEQAVRAALYIELEKERSAAASAADEAMAMILRLQEEKATVEMEARQYQRIIEEKFAYDTEEINILKDILLIRERENHSLQKEVEEYRQMINLGNEQFQEDAVEFEKKHLGSLVNASKYPVFIIDQPSASSVDGKTSLKDMQTSPCSRNGEQNVQEKEMNLSVGTCMCQHSMSSLKYQPQ